MYAPPPEVALGCLASDYDDPEFDVWEECWEAVLFFQAKIGTRWCYGGMGSPTGVRWEAVYPLIDRYIAQNKDGSQEEWDVLLDDLECVEIGALNACKPKK